MIRHRGLCLKVKYYLSSGQERIKRNPDRIAYAKQTCELVLSIGHLQGQGDGQDLRRDRKTVTKESGFISGGKCLLNQSILNWGAK